MRSNRFLNGFEKIFKNLRNLKLAIAFLLFLKKFSTFNFQLSILNSCVENKGLEPLTPCVQGRCSKPTELIPRFLN